MTATPHLLQTGRAIKAIPTTYRGVEFRSRTEARWALLFDLFAVKWEYEVEGYQLASCWYLPDFWLPEFKCFAEVKGIADHWDDLSRTKVRELALTTNRWVLLLDEMRAGNPYVRALIPQLDVDEVLTFWVNLPTSIRLGRLWYEQDEPAALDDVDSRWVSACTCAKATRFDQRRQGE